MIDIGKESYLTLDHILAVLIGGSNSLDNLQGLCRQCNLQKKDELEVAYNLPFGI